MMRCTLSLRLSHKYRDGWDYLDEWQDIGAAKILGQPRTHEPRDEDYDCDDPIITSVVASVPRAVVRRWGERRVQAALSALTAYGCQCEHDCCGHSFSRGADVRKISRRNYLLTTHHYRNI